MIGGHPIKLGLSRYLVDLIDRRIITHLATNGAGIIHDFELALAGGTSENVPKWIQRGPVRPVARNEPAQRHHRARRPRRGEGLGETVGRVIEEEQFAHRELSLAAAGWRPACP